VQLVDEQDHVGRRARLGDDRANALLVLSPVGRAGEKRDVVERQQAYRSQNERHLFGGDPLRQAFGDRGLADTGRSDEGWVVLAVAQQDVDDARDFLLSTANRLESAGPGIGGQVTCETGKHAAGGFVS
jgi:hypothetical protein